MSRYETFKFVVLPVVAVYDGDEPKGELPIMDNQKREPVVIYGLEGLKRFVDEWPDALEALNEKEEEPVGVPG